MSESIRNVMFYDTGNDRQIEAIAQQAAKNVGWHILSYSDIGYAFEDLDQTVGGIITTIGSHEELAGFHPSDLRYPSARLVEKADRIRVPRLIVSNRKEIDHYLGPCRSSKRLSPSENPLILKSALQSWIMRLEVRTR